MGSLETRSPIFAGSDFYLMPLGLKQCSLKDIRAYVQSTDVKDIQSIEATQKDGTKVLKAKVFEIKDPVKMVFADQPWSERRIVVYSVAHADSQITAFDKHLLKAQQEIGALLSPKQGKKVLSSKEQILGAIQQIEAQH